MLNHSNLTTPTERERLAYMSGDTATATLLADLDDSQVTIEGIENQLSDVQSESESFKKWEAQNGPASDYYDFFHECFQRLEGRYPCPSVSNEYDKSVIFDAIEKGEFAKNVIQDLQNEIECLRADLATANIKLLRYEG